MYCSVSNVIGMQCVQINLAPDLLCHYDMETLLLSNKMPSTYNWAYYTFNVCVTTVLSFYKGGKQLQVRLTIPWKHNVQIEYLAHSVSEKLSIFLNLVFILIKLIVQDQKWEPW